MVKAVTGFTLFQTDADAGTNSAAHSSQLSQVSPAFQNSDPSSLLKVLEHRQSNNIKISAEQKEALLEATAKFEASEILKLKEDLNQEQPVRLQTFAGSVSKHGAEYGKRLMGEMLAQDPRALETWLNPISINQATAEGQITSSQRAQIAESFAANYNAGHPTLAVQEVPLDSQSKKAKASSVDLYLSLAHVQLPQAWYRTQATKTNHFLSFINSSQGPEANQFKKDYSRHVFKSYVESNGPSAAAASGISMHLMAESNSPTEVVEFFSQYSPGERSRIFDHMAASAFRFPIAEQSRYPHEAPKEFKDSFSLFMSSVAKAKGPQAEQLALELTDKFIEKEQYDIDLSGSSTEKLKKENPVYFERVRALGEVFKNHTKPILDKYTDYDSDIVGRMQSGFPEKQFQVDTKKLANLFRLTLFNPDCPQANTIRQNVLDYSEDLKTEINQREEQIASEVAQPEKPKGVDMGNFQMGSGEMLTLPAPRIRNAGNLGMRKTNE